jgi:hypothetical protein
MTAFFKFIFPRSLLQSLVTSDFPSSLILTTLKMEAALSYETSALTEITRRHIPEHVISLPVFMLTRSQLLPYLITFLSSWVRGVHADKHYGVYIL